MPGALAQVLLGLSSGATELSAQWNAADKGSNITLSNSDRDAAVGGAGSVRGLKGRSSGSYYFEIVCLTSTANMWCALGDGSASTATYPGNSASSASVASGGNLVNTWTKAQAGTFTVAVNDTLGFAVDISNGRMWVAKNNVWQLTGDPATNTNPWVTGITGTVYPMAGGAGAGGTWRINTKQSELTYSPPSGFSRWALSP